MTHSSECTWCGWYGQVSDDALLSITARWGAGEADEVLVLKWRCPSCRGKNEELVREADFR